MVWSRDGNDENDDKDNVKKSGLAHYITAKVVTKTIQVTANLFIAMIFDHWSDLLWSWID